MTKYRLICFECTGFIKSKLIPENPDKKEEFEKRWQDRCHKFKLQSCPHYGNGAIDPKLFGLHKRADKHVNLRELSYSW